MRGRGERNCLLVDLQIIVKTQIGDTGKLYMVCQKSDCSSADGNLIMVRKQRLEHWTASRKWLPGNMDLALGGQRISAWHLIDQPCWVSWTRISIIAFMVPLLSFSSLQNSGLAVRCQGRPCRMIHTLPLACSNKRMKWQNSNFAVPCSLRIPVEEEERNSLVPESLWGLNLLFCYQKPASFSVLLRFPGRGVFFG